MQSHKVLLAVAGGLAALFCAMLFWAYTAPPRVAAMLPAWVPRQDHGHDLERRGGSYLVLRVDTAAAVHDALASRLEGVRATLLSRQILFSHLAVTDRSVDVRITDPSQLADAHQALVAFSGPAGGRLAMTLTAQPDQTLRLTLDDPAPASRAVDRDIAGLRRRLEALGVAWPIITRQANDTLVVKAPGFRDPAQLAAVLTRSADLSFHIVDELSPATAAADMIPPGDEALPGNESPMVVKRQAVITGDMLADAVAGFDQIGRPAINFRFNSEGARRFAQVTGDNIGRRFAIVLDGKVITAPVIQGPIAGGSGMITGAFTTKEASDLALLLRTGPLAAPLSVVEQRQVR